MIISLGEESFHAPPLLILALILLFLTYLSTSSLFHPNFGDQSQNTCKSVALTYIVDDFIS